MQEHEDCETMAQRTHCSGMYLDTGCLNLRYPAGKKPLSLLLLVRSSLKTY